MKDKILSTAINSAVENIAQALHVYSDKQLFCQIKIGTRGDDDKDAYDVTVVYGRKSERGEDPVMESKALISYSIEDGRELIRRVEPLSKEGDEGE